MTERACASEAIWLVQSMLLAEQADMEDIAAAIRKVQAQSRSLVDVGGSMTAKLWGISFPSIVEGLGAERVMAEAAEMGQSEFILCSIIYKGYRLVMPRHPRQIYSLETGVTFYPADENAYRGCQIRPVSTSDFAGRDLFREMAEAGSAPRGRPLGLGELLRQRTSGGGIPAARRAKPVRLARPAVLMRQ